MTTRREPSYSSLPHLLFVLTMFFGHSLSGQVPVTGLLDVNGLQASGLATFSGTPADIGHIKDIFDRNTNTLYRSANINPAEITIEFEAPYAFDHFRALCAGDTTRYRIELADTMSDLISTTGSYTLSIDWQTSPNETWITLTPAAPRVAKIVRLTANRIAGDNYVHIREFEIHTRTEVESLIITPTYAELFATETRQFDVFGNTTTDDIVLLTTDVVWESSSPGTASVTSSGGVVAVAQGATLVTATLDSLPPVSSQVTVLPLSIDSGPGRSIAKRFFGLSFDPILDSQGQQRLHAYKGWADPLTHMLDGISALRSASNERLRARLSQFINVDFWPVKADGFMYSEKQYLAGDWHMPDGVDYATIIRDYDLARRVDRGEIDEVFLGGGPYLGYWESTMVGRGGYWCNSPPQVGIPCSRIFVIMGYNPERTDTRLHAEGHRAESIMSRVYGGWDITQSRHLWERFTHNRGQSPQTPSCGSVHYPPNGLSDYDYCNAAIVQSSAIDWELNFPNLIGQTAPVNYCSWGCNPCEANDFLLWWFQHMPHHEWRNFSDGYNRLNNWWEYIFDFNRWPESGGEYTPDRPAAPAQGSTAQARAVSAAPGDEWAPQISGERIVWYGHDDEHFQIYSCNVDRSDLLQITDNGFDHEAPQINVVGQVVWQAFDGEDYEIFTSMADGTELRQVTDNTVNDWHPHINDSARIVWDRWDGNDYEVFAANIEGTSVVQVTNNQTPMGSPYDDVWARINSHGRVVWMGYDGNDFEIYSADSNGGAIAQLTDNNYDDEFPQISNSGFAVWQGRLDSSNTEIFTAPVMGGAVTRLSDNATEDWWPQMNEAGTVVWMQHDGHDWEIIRAAVTGVPAITRVTNNLTHDQYPHIDLTGRVVWQGFVGTYWAVYQEEDGVITKLSPDSFHSRWPCASDLGVVVWHGESVLELDGTRTDIFIHDQRCGADADVDRDVELIGDYEVLQPCLLGPLQPLNPGCDCRDLDDDGHVDLADFRAFQNAFTGAQPYPPH